MTAKWRRENVLASAILELHGELVDLFDPATRQTLEDRHQSLLVAHEMEHLDLHEITAKRRIVTQTIAGDLFERGAAGVQFRLALMAAHASRCSSTGARRGRSATS